MIHLVRHARAGRRGSWRGPDAERPLDAAGRADALAVADRLAPLAPARILSSPLTRCTQTVQPLADALGLPVEPALPLAEGVDVEASWALLEAVATDPLDTVLCSHGDVIPDLLWRLERRGVLLEGAGAGVAKGSIWTVEVDADGTPVAARLAFVPEGADR